MSDSTQFPRIRNLYNEYVSEIKKRNSTNHKTHTFTENSTQHWIHDSYIPVNNSHILVHATFNHNRPSDPYSHSVNVYFTNSSNHKKPNLQRIRQVTETPDSD